jgi:hypothetical protein
MVPGQHLSPRLFEPDDGAADSEPFQQEVLYFVQLVVHQ